MKIWMRALIAVLNMLLACSVAVAAPPTTVVVVSMSAVGSDLVIGWAPVSTNLYGDVATIDHYNVYRGNTPQFVPDYDNGTNRIGQPNSADFTDSNVLAGPGSTYYYVTAVNSDGIESLIPSFLAQNIRLGLHGGAYWISLPYDSPLVTASDLAALSPNISEVARFDPVTQSEQVWDAGAGTGTDFPFMAGEGIAIGVTDYTVLNLVGMHAPTDIVLNYNASDFNRQWIGLPQPSAYENASDLLPVIPGATKVAIYDPVDETYKSWFDLDGNIIGDDFPINPGVSVVVSVESAGTFVPALARPDVSAESVPDSGYESISVTLTANASDADGSIASYQWDVDGDGTFDASGQEIQHTYQQPGTYRPTVLVIDDDGHRAVAFSEVSIGTLNVGLSTSGFEPLNGESTSIDYTLPESGEVTVRIYDGNGQLIRTLLENAAQASGSHNVIWDGRDDTSNIAVDGAYFVTIEFTEGGFTSVYDPRDTEGGIDITDALSDISISDTLSPLESEYVQISYMLPENALVTIVIRDLGGAVIRNLLVDIARTPGTHTETWDGSKDSGGIIDPGTTFTVSISATSLGGNSVVAQGLRPEFSNVSAEPLRFSPSTNPYGSNRKNAVGINFTLSQPGDVTANVLDGEGNLVRAISQTGLAAGANEISWNGRNSGGILVADGYYLIRLQAAGGAGVSDVFSVQAEIFY